MDELLKLFNEPFSIKNVRLFSDGGGDPSQDGADDATGTGDDTGDGGAGDTGDNQDADSGNQDTGDSKTFDEKYVKELRDEAAKYRKERKQYADDKQKLENQIKSIQKALGLDDGEPDEKALEEKLNAKETELRSLKVENAFSKVARKAGADEDLTLAVLHRKGKLNDLDPDDNLEGSLEDLVKQELESNPKLKAGEVEKPNTGDADPQPDQGVKKSFNDMIRRAAGRA